MQPPREQDFEAAIEAALQQQGYTSLPHTAYDRALCMLPDQVIAFIEATQLEQWQEIKRIAGSTAAARQAFLEFLKRQIDTFGTLHLLRNGIKHNGTHLRLVYFPPAHGFNQAYQRLYQANIFNVVRQLHFSQKSAESLDLALFINGLPVITAELKTLATGQRVEHAIHQYRQNRDPKEPLFDKRRCIAHFAIDPLQAYVSTHLNRKETRFLPFNQGYNHGAGNPPSGTRAATAYLWEEVWQPASLLNLLEYFVQDLQHGVVRATANKQPLIFPRYHQLQTVRHLLEQARNDGAGHHYLVQHSAGSGKSNTIAWLAYQLTTLYTTPPASSSEERLFHSIIIITDRRVLDRQLQQTVSQFTAPDGLIQVIDESSQQLLQALAAGKQIIITTLQKFPVVVRYISNPDSLPEGTRYAMRASTLDLRGKRFALIIDEAHSSQSGEQMRAVREALRTELNLDLPTAAASSSAPDAPPTLDPETLIADDPDDPDAPPTLDPETLIAETIRQRGKQPHISIFAFTATPKTKTLELFGKRMPDGSHQAHSLYTMRQAIEEGFILDVLAHYTTYRSLWRLQKTIADDPRYETRKASALLAAFVHDHPTAIDQKAQIIVEHLRASVVEQIGGQARAMLVTSSRRQAVRYKLAIDAYIAAQGYPERAIVAFSGEVRDNGTSYTEAGMNGFSDSETPQRIKADPYRLLIVANKYQTGYDEPLMHTMYVDKKLGGVNAVQTLSRLNRIAHGKRDPQVVDFVNDVDTIRNAFEPYYTTTILSEGTDPNLLFEMQTALDASHIYTPAEITAVTDMLFTAAPTEAAERIPSLLQPAVARYQQHETDVQQEFRKTLDRFVRLYAFVTQISSFAAPDLERLYQYGRLLLRHLPATEAGVPADIYQHVALASYETRKVRSGAIKLDTEVAPLTPPHGGVGSSEPLLSTKDPLSQIIEYLNQQYGVNLNGAAIASLQHVREKIGSDEAVAAAFRANPPNVARNVFDERVEELIEGFIDDNVRLYEHIKRNPELANKLRDLLFRLFLDDIGGAGAPPEE